MNPASRTRNGSVPVVVVRVFAPDTAGRILLLRRANTGHGDYGVESAYAPTDRPRPYGPNQ